MPFSGAFRASSVQFSAIEGPGKEAGGNTVTAMITERDDPLQCKRRLERGTRETHRSEQTIPLPYLIGQSAGWWRPSALLLVQLLLLVYSLRVIRKWNYTELQPTTIVFFFVCVFSVYFACCRWEVFNERKNVFPVETYNNTIYIEYIKNEIIGFIFLWCRWVQAAQRQGGDIAHQKAKASKLLCIIPVLSYQVLVYIACTAQARACLYIPPRHHHHTAAVQQEQPTPKFPI